MQNEKQSLLVTLSTAGQNSSLTKGDVVIVTRLDRLARSTRDLLNLLASIAEKGAGFKSLGRYKRDLHVVRHINVKLKQATREPAPACKNRPSVTDINNDTLVGLLPNLGRHTSALSLTRETASVPERRDSAPAERQARSALCLRF
jgi:hypothetical protein